MKISRKRYVVMRDNRSKIFSGNIFNCLFRDVNDIGNFQIKTFPSELRAEIEMSGHCNFEIVPIIETIEVL